MSLSFQADNFYSKFARMFIKDRNARNAALGPGEDRETGNCQSLHCINHMGNLAMGDAVESEVCSCMVQGVWFSSVQFSLVFGLDFFGHYFISSITTLKGLKL